MLLREVNEGPAIVDAGKVSPECSKAGIGEPEKSFNPESPGADDLKICTHHWYQQMLVANQEMKTATSLPLALGLNIKTDGRYQPLQEGKMT